METFAAKIAERWGESDAVTMGAYALWLVNWVHPFKNGNGRTARAFCYACLSLKLGFVLPGTPTVIDLVMQNREEYQAALKVGDIGFAQTGEPDLSAMYAFVEKLLIQQLAAVGD
jgi:Fic family protein